MADTATIQARLAEAEEALHALMTGSREEEVVWADGRRSKYTTATLPQLQAYIADLKAQLIPRRPIFFDFGR